MKRVANKKLVGIDFDDVIFNLAEHLLEFFNKRFNTSFKHEDITMYQLGELWHLDREEEKKIINEFCFSDLHNISLPINGAIEGVKELSKNYDLIVVTARDDERGDITYRWLDEKLPNVFKSVVFTNHNHEDETKRRKKSEVCRELGVDIFIDDSLSNVLDVSPAVERVFLLDKPWNKGQLPDNVLRVSSWTEIVEEMGLTKKS